MTDSILFDRDFLRKLEQFSILSKKLRKGAVRGEHRVIHRGMSTEFHDYRNYNSGDDLRYIDWNIYGRLEKLLIKIFSGEEDQSVHILLDTSLSMNDGNPAKMDYAKKIAGALAYIAVHSLDRVGITSFSDRMGEMYVPERRLSSLRTLFSYLEAIEADGSTEFNRALREYALKVKRPGTAVIISDLLDAKGYEEGLLSLIYRKFDVIVLQVLSEEELSPRLYGSYRLIDAESGEKLSISADKKFMDEYDTELASWFSSIELFCRKKRIDYIRSGNLVPIEDFLLRYLREGGMIG
ncbi:DUF58 domain-containing protein [Spirochaeta isovalerica]|uniref:Uncharacterized protein (DUF58 family) n=1 Tax=Spirochaeta isovalerica TaxID=150 RepID=A0A841R5S1_9SPIO|nr:DUF58 domain-containing protein [Spirochaeta isovalerica]MBB6478497.1 uncharacterized protein (DUF58 family) [Spirochaeta isovalerica]